MSTTLEIIVERCTLEFIGTDEYVCFEFIEEKIVLLEFVEQGPKGLSAYEIAVANGFAGTEDEWLLALKGADGEDGDDGLSAYQVAVENGFAGSEAEWLMTIKGVPGENGKSAYEVAQSLGYSGTEDEWLTSLKGEKGDDGEIAASGGTMTGTLIHRLDGTAQQWQKADGAIYAEMKGNRSFYVKDDAPAGERYLIYGEANYGRKFGLYVEASGNEGGFKADSVFYMKCASGVNIQGGASAGGVVMIGQSGGHPIFVSNSSIIRFGSDSGHTTQFISQVEAPVRAYNAVTWDGSARVVTEEAIRDEIESLRSSIGDGGGGGDVPHLKVGDPYDDAGYAAIIRAPTNGYHNSLKLVAENQTAEMKLGWGEIRASNVLFVRSVSDFGFGTDGNAPCHLFTNGTLRVTVTAGGNVGIGTADAKARLHSTGSTILGAASAPVADADLGDGQVNVWVNEATDELTFKVKYSNGTVKTAKLPLS